MSPYLSLRQYCLPRLLARRPNRKLVQYRTVQRTGRTRLYDIPIEDASGQSNRSRRTVEKRNTTNDRVPFFDTTRSRHCTQYKYCTVQYQKDQAFVSRRRRTKRNETKRNETKKSHFVLFFSTDCKYRA